MQSYRLITVATLVDRLKINGSLARKALHDLEEKGQIKKVVGHSKLSIYSEWIPSSMVGKCETRRSMSNGVMHIGDEMGRIDEANPGRGMMATIVPVFYQG